MREEMGRVGSRLAGQRQVMECQPCIAAEAWLPPAPAGPARLAPEAMSALVASQPPTSEPPVYLQVEGGSMWGDVAGWGCRAELPRAYQDRFAVRMSPAG